MQQRRVGAAALPSGLHAMCTAATGFAALAIAELSATGALAARTSLFLRRVLFSCCSTVLLGDIHRLQLLRMLQRDCSHRLLQLCRSHRVILLRQQPHLHSRATTIATRQVQPAVSPAPLPPAVMSRGISSIAVCKVHIYGCCIGGGSWVIESSKSFTTPASRAGEAAGGDDGKVAEFARSPVIRALTAVEVRVDQTPAILLLFAGLRLRPETKMKIISQNSHSRFKKQAL
jgi:hypothetical protein